MHQSHSGAFDGHVGSRAQGDADIGLGQRGCIVDAVPGHRHRPSFCLKPFDRFVFLRRADFGDDFLDAELPRHGLGSRSAIAGEHDDVHAVLSKAAKRLQAGRPDGIGHAEYPG